MRKAEILMHGIAAGILSQDESGYKFEYKADYLTLPTAQAISLTMPMRKEEYTSKVLFPFFDGLIPEGWLLNLAGTNWKINPKDRMGLLLVCCQDCIGAVSVHNISDVE